MRPLRRDYGQSYPPPEYAGHGGSGYQLSGGQVQNGGGMGQQQPGGMQQHHQQQQQQMQQQQQQHQQQQQQQQQQGRPGQPGGVQGGGEPQPNAPPEMNLANVLHYLQSEWRRWERDRNEWEIERAEMRVSSASGINTDDRRALLCWKANVVQLKT